MDKCSASALRICITGRKEKCFELDYTNKNYYYK